MEKLLYGAAYYDEYMPYDRVLKDMEMMHRAGMNVIRIAESTWSTWEKKEGEFDFTSLHRMLDAAKKYDISVIVGTPTYAIPSWLAMKEEGILAVTHSGPGLYGHRQNMDITNPTYLKYARRIIEKLMEEVRDEPHVIGFQLDNETKSYDTCSPRAQKMFVDRLKKRFPDINEFNREFGLDYWSNRVDDWDFFPDIRGTINGSLAAEYAAFQRELVTEFLAWQEEIIRPFLRSDQFVTHNFDCDWDEKLGGLGYQPEVDQFEAAKCMTVAGCDIYHPSAQDLTGAEITVLGNIFRGLKQDNYLVLETEAQGNLRWLPYPGQLRLCAYSHIANGANMVEYWHWHSIHNAIESYWKGVLSHDLQENDTYRECSVVGNEWKRIGDHLTGLKKTNRVAIVVDSRSNTGLRQFEMEREDGHGYNRVYRMLADSLYEMNVEFDVIPADEGRLGEYDVILLPALYSARRSFLEALDRFVLNGGYLVGTFKTGFSDEHLKIYAEQQPCVLGKAFGIYYDRFTVPRDVSVSFGGASGRVSEWMEMVQTDTAEVLSYYEHPVWNRYAAATCNAYGKGRAMYLSCFMERSVVKALLQDFLSGGDETGSRLSVLREDREIQAKFPLVVKRGINRYGKNITYLLNFSGKEQEAVLKGQDTCFEELLTQKKHLTGERISLPAWGVAVLEYE